MALTKCKLGDYIELRGETNTDLVFGPADVRGVNNLKLLMQTKADINGRDLTKFQIVYPGEFVFNHRTSRNGSKFSIAYNDGDKPVICTEDYVVFRIREESRMCLVAEWLYMFFNRSEFDRYVITNSWGSSTEFYNWEDLCTVELALPSYAIQQKYVDIYKAMIANQQSYERGLEDLKLAIDGMLDQIKTEAPQIPLGELLAEIDNRNSDKAQSLVYGVTMSKQFIPSVANLDGVDISKYKLVATDQIACNFMHVGRDKSLPLAINQTDDPIVVSPAYFVFEKASELCLPEYIVMWLSREESGRYCWFISDSSVRGGFSLEQFYSITIPVTSIDQQYALTSIYNSYITRKEINDKLKMQIKSICPILIKGSLEEE
ncbi:MAG: restriction endonuclease subunit S [Clostridiales bacterium]|nr:restriction endonuclease subunit S [Clostridiales bacterium]